MVICLSDAWRLCHICVRQAGEYLLEHLCSNVVLVTTGAFQWSGNPKVTQDKIPVIPFLRLIVTFAPAIPFSY